MERESTRTTSSADLSKLRAALTGELITSNDTGYDEARRVWNGMIDRYPLAIARCAGAADVQAAIRFARDENLPLAVRGGGHNVAGSAVCDDGIVIDLRGLVRTDVDRDQRRVVAGGGLTWGEFDAATAKSGLATVGGLISSTGVGGLTLGGGIGWLTREHGLTCDNLTAAEVVTADGRVLRVSADDNADLFWGLRGGGGNFGVVTQFEFRLHPVHMVLGGLVMHEAARARDVLAFWRDYTASAPDSVTTLLAFLTAPPAPFVPPALQGKPVVAIVTCCTDTSAAGEATIAPLRTFGPPAVDLLGPMPYTALQTMLDAGAAAGRHNYFKAGFLDTISDGAIEALFQAAASVTSPFAQVHIHHLGGAANRVAPDATAYPHRSAQYAYNVIATWLDRAESDRHIRWARDGYAGIEPFSTGGVYVNFLGDEGQDRIRAAFGPGHYDRLVALKRTYDPGNLFRSNQNIRP